MLVSASEQRRSTMSESHDPATAIGRVSHYFGHLSVAAISLDQPLAVGERIHIQGHTTNFVQDVGSMEVEHRHVERAGPGDDVAIKVDEHVREHDLVFRES
jgi:putative protease